MVLRVERIGRAYAWRLDNRSGVVGNIGDIDDALHIPRSSQYYHDVPITTISLIVGNRSTAAHRVGDGWGEGWTLPGGAWMPITAPLGSVIAQMERDG